MSAEVHAKYTPGNRPVHVYWNLKYLVNPETGERHCLRVWRQLSVKQGFRFTIHKSRVGAFAAIRAEEEA